jgi:hypothetical protein
MKKTFFIPAPPKKNGDCKYKPNCSFYATDSYTCTHGGGNYCGRYRKLCKSKKDKLPKEGYLETPAA